MKSFKEHFATIINEEKMSSKSVEYWSGYEKDTSGQGSAYQEKRFENKNQIRSFIVGAIEDWNRDAEEGSDLKTSERKSIINLATNFFNETGWINMNIIHAMIFQN